MLPFVHHFSPSRSRARSSRAERGFALTEVIIAAVILVLVSGAFLQLVVGSSNAQASMKVRQKQQAVAEGLIEHLRVDTSWTDECTVDVPGAPSRGDGGPRQLDPNCKIEVGDKYQNAPFTLDETGKVRYKVTAQAVPVDSRADGVYPADKDPVDFFRVTTTITAPEGVEVDPLRSTSVVDPSNGNAPGTVTLKVCEMPNQTDERAVVTNCTTQPTFLASEFDAADNYAAIPANRKRMDVRPVPTGTSVTLHRILASGTAAPVVARTAADGSVSFSELAAGRYRVAVTPSDARMTPWASKSIPTTKVDGFAQEQMVVTVSSSNGSEGVIAFRYATAPDYTVRVESVVKGDGTAAKPDVVTPTAMRTVTMRLIPMPAGRAPIVTKDMAAVSEYNTATKVPVTKVVIKAPTPGLYRAFIVNNSGGVERLVHYAPGPSHTALDYIWIAPTGASMPVGANEDADSAAYQVTVRPPNITGIFDDYDADTGADPPQTFPVRAPELVGDCTWTTAPNRAAAGGDPDRLIGYRTCAPCPGTRIYHQAWGSTVNIKCEDGANCDQDNITLSNGQAWLGALFDAWFGGIGLHGGSLTAVCYKDADCTQSGTVAGNRNNIFSCLEDGDCTQHMGQSPSLIDTSGGSADVQCFTGADCRQNGIIVPGTVMTARCYPNSHCTQTIHSGTTLLGGRGGPATMECYQRSTCKQYTQKTPNFFDWIFGEPPAGPLNMVCSWDSSCDQEARIGSFSQGFNVHCWSRGACLQRITVGATFGLGAFGRGGGARQACFQRANCDQIVSRNAPSTSIDQSCFPAQGIQEDAEAAVGPACNLVGRSTVSWFFFIPITVETPQRQVCRSQETCDETVTSGGGLFGTIGEVPFEQTCVSRRDCVQRITRTPAFIGGLVGNVFQNCQTSRGKCDQWFSVADMSFFPIGSFMNEYLRQQICDSRVPCKQQLYSQTGAFLQTLFGAGPKNPVYQLCNRRFNADGNLVNTPEREPVGDFNPDPSSGGGA